MTADKNPNRRGLEWIARGMELALKPFSELAQAINGGKVKALYAIGGEVPVDPSLVAHGFARLEYVVLQAANESGLNAPGPLALPLGGARGGRGDFHQPRRHHPALPARLPAARGREASLGVGGDPGPGVRVPLGARQRPGRVPRVGAARGGAQELRLGWRGAAGEARPGDQPHSHRGGWATAGIP